MPGKPWNNGAGSSPVIKTMWFALILAPSLCDLETNPPCVYAALKFGNKDKGGLFSSPISVSKNSTVENNATAVQDEK